MIRPILRKTFAFLCKIVLLPCRILVLKILGPIFLVAFDQINRWSQDAYDRSAEGQRAKKEREERDAYIARQLPQVRGMINPPEGVTRDEVESSSDFGGCDLLVNCAAHEDGLSVVVYSRDEEDMRDGARHIARVCDTLFGRQPYTRTEIELQEVPKSRIVQRVCNIPQGIRLVRPGIGSLSNLTLPNLKWEASPGSDWISLSRQAESDLLTLYYRWALHAISAIAFCHRKRVYLEALDSSSFWIQSDFSLVLVGLSQARIPAPDYVWEQSEREMDDPGGPKHWRYDFITGRWYTCPARNRRDSFPYEAAYSVVRTHDMHHSYENGPYMLPENVDIIYNESFGQDHMDHDLNIDSTAKEDIFRWAIFVLRLFTNNLSKNDQVDISDWSLCTSTCPSSRRANYRGRRGDARGATGFKLHDSADWLLNLRPEQLGSVLVKAFKGEFESADDVLVDLRRALEELGRDVDSNDDVLPGQGRCWEVVFTVVKGDEGDYRKHFDPVWAREIRFVGNHLGTESVEK